MRSLASISVSSLNQIGGFLCALPVLLCLSGCSSSVYHYVRHDREIGNVRRVAILPFRNISGRKKASQVITSIFVNEIFKSGLFIIESEGNIRDFFIYNRIRIKGELDKEKLRMLHDRMGVDAVFMGMVEEYTPGSREKRIPRVALSVRMVSTRTARILWTSRHEASGDDYIVILDIGKIRSITRLVEKVIQEMLETMET